MDLPSPPSAELSPSVHSQQARQATAIAEAILASPKGNTLLDKPTNELKIEGTLLSLSLFLSLSLSPSPSLSLPLPLSLSLFLSLSSLSPLFSLTPLSSLSLFSPLFLFLCGSCVSKPHLSPTSGLKQRFETVSELPGPEEDVEAEAEADAEEDEEEENEACNLFIGDLARTLNEVRPHSTARTKRSLAGARHARIRSATALDSTLALSSCLCPPTSCVLLCPVSYVLCPPMSCVVSHVCV